MSLFDNMLGSGQTIFKDSIALDFDYVPKLIPYREQEQMKIVNCIKPLFAERNGRNCIVTGKPGIGKTLACKHIVRELEDETDEIYTVFVSCWQKNSSYKIMVEVCEQLGYKFTHNKRTDELFEEVKKIVNKSSAVFIFDEIDKVDDFDFLYMILEEVYKKSIILITNYKDKLMEVDERIRSRLTPEVIKFNPYTFSETKGIIKHRSSFAFISGSVTDSVIDLVASKAYEVEDIRTGLFLLREAGENAESNSRKQIIIDDVSSAINKKSELKIKETDDLDDISQGVLKVVRDNSGKKIGEIFKIYQEKEPNAIYKTFQRKIKKLSDNKYITTKTITGGKDGSTTIIDYDGTKKLTDF